MGQAQSFDVQFTRALLSQVMEDVREHTTVEERKAAWTYHHMKDHWEFHGPNQFYWHGRADTAYDARYKGWSAYLASKGVEGYAMKED